MPAGALQRLQLKNFTAFAHLDLTFASGINVLVGGNATGKTHILKVLYAAEVSRSQHDFVGNILGAFNPTPLKHLLSRGTDSADPAISILGTGGDLELYLQLVQELSIMPEMEAHPTTTGQWSSPNAATTYIPCKEILAHAAGFRSLYTQHDIAFERTYFDIIDKAFFPPLKSRPEKAQQLLALLETKLGGTVESGGNEQFFLEDQFGRLEFSLVAEGLRKLALLWLLINNGRIAPGTTLLWDEPEANLNPTLLKTVVEVLLALARWGVQVFVATHSYFLLKELDLQAQPGDDVLFHCLARGKDGAVEGKSVRNYLDIDPNLIAEAFGDIRSRDLARAVRQSKGPA